MKNKVILWPPTSSKIIVLVAQPISTDGGPPVLAVGQNWAGQVVGEKGGLTSVKVAHVYIVLRYYVWSTIRAICLGVLWDLIF